MGAMMDLDLSPGDYTLVTTFNGYHEVLFMNMILNPEDVQMYHYGMVKFTMLTIDTITGQTL